LGGGRSDEYFHYARNIHVDIREWFDEREPDRNDYLHADRNQCLRREHLHGHGDRHRKLDGQAYHQFLHGQSYEHFFGFQQHAELGDNWGDKYFHYARDIHIDIPEWFDECEPDRNDHLHANCDQHFWLRNFHDKSHAKCPRRSIDYNNQFLPQRNTRRGIYRLHDSRHRRLSPIHIFRKREFQFFSVA
jgi:hypothetical protein